MARGSTSKKAAAAKVEKFVAAMLDPKNKENATQCAIIAGYAKRSAKQEAYKLMQREDVKARVEAMRAEVSEKVGLSVERTLREVARLAYFDPRRLYNADGTLKKIAELDDDTAAAIASVKVVEMAGGMEINVPAGANQEELEAQPQGGALKRTRAPAVQHVAMYTKEVKHWDKNSALDKAMKHLGLYERDNAQQPVAQVHLPGVKTVKFEPIRARK